MAPEVIMHLGHSRAADWYTLGILLYELTVGRPPFSNPDPFKIFEMVLKRELPFPEDYCELTKEFILELTNHDLT